MTESSPVFADGFGRRVVRVTDRDTPPTEHLLLDSVLAGHSGFKAALRDRATQLHGRRLTSYARMLRVESEGADGLAIVSEHIRGWRLADLLDVAESENLTFDIGVVILLLRQLLPTAALFGSQGRDAGSGALGPEHLLLTPQARLVLTDYVLGSAVAALGWSPDRLWRTLRIAAPAGADRAVSPRGDVVQVGVTVLSLIVGRRLRDDEFPERLGDLVTSARQKTPSVIHAPLSTPLREWLLGALQLQPKSFATMFDAQMALERLLAAEPSLLAQPIELETAIARFARFMPEFELPVPPAEVPLLEAPAAGLVPLDVAFDRTPAPMLAPAPPAPSVDVAPAPALLSTRKSGVRKKAVASVPAHVAETSAAAPMVAPLAPPDVTPVDAIATASVESLGATDWFPAPAPDLQPEPAFVVQSRTTQPEPMTEFPVDPRSDAARHMVTSVAPMSEIDDLVAQLDAFELAVAAPAPSAPSPVFQSVSSVDSGSSVEPAPVVRRELAVQPKPAAAWTPQAVVPIERMAAPAVATTEALPVAWWRSPRVAAALAAVALAQTLMIGWLVSRPGEGLGGDGEVVVQSRPEGARVTIDDQDHGVTPLTVRVRPGTHVLQVRAGTSEPRVIPLLIRPGVQTAQYVELMGVATTGVLEVRSEPAKARVTIDGHDRGSTPLTLRDVLPGDYQIVLERAGWKTAQTVRVEPGATAQLVVPIR